MLTPSARSAPPRARRGLRPDLRTAPAQAQTRAAAAPVTGRARAAAEQRPRRRGGVPPGCRAARSHPSHRATDSGPSSAAHPPGPAPSEPDLATAPPGWQPICRLRGHTAAHRSHPYILHEQRHRRPARRATCEKVAAGKPCSLVIRVAWHVPVIPTRPGTGVDAERFGLDEPI